MRKRHFLIYYDNRTKEITRTTPRTWAKANQAHFPTYTFIGDDHPRDSLIEGYIVRNYGFITEIQDDFVVTFNFNQFIPLSNALDFIL